MREFIVPILIGSIRLLGPFCEIKIKSDHYIAGSRGYGPVDLDILFHMYHIVVCEAKNGKNIIDVIPQNGAQLVACREIYQRAISKKRKRNKAELSSELDKLKSYGIVSTGRDWVFICYYKDDEGNWLLEKSIPIHLPLYPIPEERYGLKERITKLLAIVAGILLSQKSAVEDFEDTLEVFKET